ncbi:MAG: hypothetical protein DME22_14965 [Verrucomicrobia bacterium]|nr:MAG: hypothetical protein DME22_14965 [Verrucomicrobiota bacterium]
MINLPLTSYIRHSPNFFRVVSALVQFHQRIHPARLIRCSSEHAVFIDTTNEPTRSGQLSEKFAANAETVLIETACALNQNRVRPLIGADERGILSTQRRGGAKNFNHG